MALITGHSFLHLYLESPSPQGNGNILDEKGNIVMVKYVLLCVLRSAAREHLKPLGVRKAR